MFTGIIEQMGTVQEIISSGTNKTFWIASPLSDDFVVDQSIAHNGVCLTVVRVESARHEVVAINETLEKSNLGALKVGAAVNLERCMLNNGRFDGHIVQGHVDQTGVVKSIREQQGSWLFDFEYDRIRILHLKKQ